MVDLEGAIAADSPAAADRIIRGLEAAFAAEGTAGVMLRINSPGGSPVQARRIYAAMERLRAEHPDIPLYAVAGDMAASGGYYVAAGADRIFADPASLVGSIGVIMGGFGYTEAMEKLGVERRLYTAGRNKAMLDPFSRVRSRRRTHVSAMLDEIHEQFIDAVRKGRGDRLAESEELFSGLIWTGERALALGLVDELATPEHVAAEVIGTERTIDYTPRGGLIERITRQLGSTTAAVLERLTRPSAEW
ncbi:MAG: S49 family peptidase [Arhodomonas sp.]|nr:S49 family peptidase [Arhodomonas sp.]